MIRRLRLSLFISAAFTACHIAKGQDKIPNQIPIVIFTDSQTTGGYGKRVVFMKAIDRGDYDYIPHDSSYAGIDAVLTHGHQQMKISPDKRPVSLYWNSECNDGYFILTITPEQVYFSTGHDNPNRNYLYWILDINDKQFKAINTGLRTRLPAYLYDPNLRKEHGMFNDQSQYAFVDSSFRDRCTIPGKWRDSTSNHYDDCCHKSVGLQLTKFIKILNSYIPAGVRKVVLPDLPERLLMSPKYISSSKRRIFDWAPIERKIN